MNFSFSSSFVQIGKDDEVSAKQTKVLPEEGNGACSGMAVGKQEEQISG